MFLCMFCFPIQNRLRIQIDGRNLQKSLIIVVKFVAYINLIVTARRLSICVGYLEETYKYFAFSIISRQLDDASSWHPSA